MSQVLINGIVLKPQPTNREWSIPIVSGKLNGTQETAAYYVMTLQAPKMNGQYFNWRDFENTVLNSFTIFAPGESPESLYTTYQNAVARKIQSFQSPEDQTVTGISMEVMVIVDSEFTSFA